tara:strand:+ start:437 stop:565 length:129 start_codon:yes stop_codon:yes gene_type:complete
MSKNLSKKFDDIEKSVNNIKDEDKKASILKELESKKKGVVLK